MAALRWLDWLLKERGDEPELWARVMYVQLSIGDVAAADQTVLRLAALLQVCSASPPPGMLCQPSSRYALPALLQVCSASPPPGMLCQPSSRYALPALLQVCSASPPPGMLCQPSSRYALPALLQVCSASPPPGMLCQPSLVALT